MRMPYILMIIYYFMLPAHVFADDNSSSKSCDTIAKTCKKAGYTKGYNSEKQFWKHCMKPVIMQGNCIKQPIVIPTISVYKHHRYWPKGGGS